MSERWIEFLLVAYICTCLDIIVTARGLLLRIGTEGNPLVTWVGGPLQQIFFLATTLVVGFWIVFFGVSYLIRVSGNPRVKTATSYGMLLVSFTHLYGASTWLEVL